QQLLRFYKPHIGFITESAVNPDMRRYATKYEAMRHYMDIDHWDTIPFKKIPRNFEEALVKFSSFYLISTSGDSIKLKIQFNELDSTLNIGFLNTNHNIKKKDFMGFITQELMPLFYEDEIKVSSLKFNYWLKNNLIDSDKFPTIVLKDEFTDFGILPYYIEQGYNKLVKAYVNKNKDQILRHAADLGHYVGDLHTPLHTVANYNGQMTDQVGIHPFWESRVPELFALEEYDFFVGKAVYIDDVRKYIWDILTDTHIKAAVVLNVEKELSKQFPPDKQWCFDVRLDQTVRIQCREYAKAYQNALKGMVEEQMTKTIKTTGDLWYTAWIDAGSPDLRKLDKNPLPEEKIITDPNLKVREY
ncbi:MAG TPA: zinc dependent phospholipase C family protein, partial [Saprospiraceae bacterium]|nr:zinc dependent phospholipase C family protein [Saprospiraceae bacterium]